MAYLLKVLDEMRLLDIMAFVPAKRGGAEIARVVEERSSQGSWMHSFASCKSGQLLRCCDMVTNKHMFL